MRFNNDTKQNWDATNLQSKCSDNVLAYTHLTCVAMEEMPCTHCITNSVSADAAVSVVHVRSLAVVAGVVTEVKARGRVVFVPA